MKLLDFLLGAIIAVATLHLFFILAPPRTVSSLNLQAVNLMPVHIPSRHQNPTAVQTTRGLPQMPKPEPVEQPKPRPAINIHIPLPVVPASADTGPDTVGAAGLNSGWLGEYTAQHLKKMPFNVKTATDKDSNNNGRTNIGRIRDFFRNL